MTYDDRKDMNAHICSIDATKLYSNHLVVHLGASKKRILEKYKKE